MAVQYETAQLFGDLLGHTLLLYRLEHPPNEVNPARSLVEELEASASAWYLRVVPEPARVLIIDTGQIHDVFDVVELTQATLRVRTAFLFELGEELKVRVEDNGKTTETTARVLAHVGTGDDKITELELGERTAV